jgi:hypothetical protein
MMIGCSMFFFRKTSWPNPNPPPPPPFSQAKALNPSDCAAVTLWHYFLLGGVALGRHGNERGAQWHLVAVFYRGWLRPSTDDYVSTSSWCIFPLAASSYCLRLDDGWSVLRMSLFVCSSSEEMVMPNVRLGISSCVFMLALGWAALPSDGTMPFNLGRKGRGLLRRFEADDTTMMACQE